MSGARLRIAVVGSGAAGLTAAWLLQRRHDVAVFEQEPRPGGHTNTIEIPDGPDAGTPVDTGFIVMNNRNYPLLTRLLAELGCATRWSDMSFGFSSEKTGLAYAGTGLGGLLAQPANLLRPSFWGLWREVARFCRTARATLSEGTLGGQSLGDFLAAHRIAEPAVRQYILPMAAAIWSAPQDGLLAFPAESLLSFWENHGLLALEDRPRWQTVVGGSWSYVKAIRQVLGDRLRTGAPVDAVRRDATGAHLQFRGGGEARFDRVVLATHADQALRLLADPSPDEHRLLGAWRYARNLTVLHTDESFMPRVRRAWASWNYVEERDQLPGRAVPVTYWMNNLQGLRTQRTYLVTLNPSRAPRNGTTVKEFVYEHPQYTAAAVATQAQLPLLNGLRNTVYCGSYFGHGFHEDAVRSGVAAAARLGVDWA